MFLALANDVGMERLPAAMAQLGAACALVSPPGFYCGKTRFIECHFSLPGHKGIWLGVPFARARLEAAVRAWQPNLIVPIDNVAALFLRNLVTKLPITSQLRDLIKVSLGAPGGYAAACCRVKLMDAASALPIRLPRYHVARDENTTLQTAAGWGYPVVLKAEHTCGGHGVVIASNPAALRTALAEMSGLTGLWQRCRSAGRQWMWGLAGMTEISGMPPLLQAMIPGVPAMRTVSAWEGRVLDGVSFVAEHVHPAPTGASTMVRYIQHAEMEDTSRRIVEALGCSGFVSFDFILDTDQDAAYLIEMNPRPISTTHLSRIFGHDAIRELLAQVQGEAIPYLTVSTKPHRPVALFPKELERDPFNLNRLDSNSILHDVPYDDPLVVAAYQERLLYIHPEAAGFIARLLVQDSSTNAAIPVATNWHALPDSHGGAAGLIGHESASAELRR
jgi:hypothetical protein